MVFPDLWWIPVVVSFVFCAMGFYKFVWFMSIGYGVSSAAIGVCMLVMSIIGGQFHWLYAVECVILVAYGIRLGGFLLIRQLKNEKYREKMKQVGGDAKVPIFVSIFMWIYCGFIYVMQSAGLVYRYYNGVANQPKVWAFIGVGIAALGFVVEAIADKQKSAAKAKNPDMPAMDGLYKICRCPNYFGEMLFWTGIFVSGIGALQGWQWLVAIIGYVQIIFVMISGAKRVEGRHIKNYGDKEEYWKYANSVPLVFPLIPLYHMTTPEKLKAEEAAKKAKAEARKAKYGKK